jgi:hypothetical protein
MDTSSAHSSISSGLANEEIPIVSGMPAPKVWQRASRKQVTQSFVPSARSTQLDPCNNNIPSESDPTVLDEWSRDFLCLVGLNER